MKITPLLFLLFFIFHSANAQDFIPFNVPVFENGEELANPWAGGLNAPQWASADLNDDGLPDLFAFDRNGAVHLPFINQDGSPGNIDYRYDFYAKRKFPSVRYFVLMRDFNGDGVVDMFSSSFDEFQSSIKVFRGRWEGGLLNFDRMTFPTLDHDVLHHELDGEIMGQVKVYVASDYPVVDDIDGDGDLDILAANQAGQKVIYYKNISLEKGFTTDTLIFELADDCWGKLDFPIDSAGFELSDNPDECAFMLGPSDPSSSHRTFLHGSSTLCTYDADGDGDKELLYGDIISPDIIMGLNGGTPEAAWMTEQDIVFPMGSSSIYIPDFPATFHLDVDNDGARDLIASPNLEDVTTDREVVHFYQNVGTDAQPNFQLQTTELLVDGILDFGTGASPTFADVNADGLLDIVVGNRYEFSENGNTTALALLLNVGTATAPVFNLVDRNWLNFNQLGDLLEALSPTFGDLDGDGDDDLLIGDGYGRLHFAENTAAAGQPMIFTDFEFNWKDLVIGLFATPSIIDLNDDGLLDLVVGERNGTVNFFPNLGSVSSPEFHPEPNEPPNNFFLGEINTQPQSSVVGYSQPAVLDFGNEKQIITGTFEGWFQRHLVDEANLSGGAFELLNEKLGGLREGSITRIALANLNGNNYLEAVVGNDRGGLSLFQSPIALDGTVNVSESADNESIAFEMFPNPTNGTVTLKGVRQAKIEVVDLFGQVVFTKNVKVESTALNLAGLPAGAYFVRVQKAEQIETACLLIYKK